MNGISAEIRAELERRYKIAAIVVAAQIAATIILIFTGWFFAGKTANDVTSNSLMTLWAAVLFIAAGTFVLRRMLSSWDRLKNTALLKGVSGVPATLQVNAIILGSLAEVIAVIGFLISALNGIKSDMFRAGIVALIVFLIIFPRKSVWEKIIMNLERSQEV